MHRHAKRWQEHRSRRAAARKEMRKSLCKLLPEAFWEHARESRREAKLACAAFRRAVKGHLNAAHPKQPAGSQKIEIA